MDFKQLSDALDSAIKDIDAKKSKADDLNKQATQASNDLELARSKAQDLRNQMVDMLNTKFGYQAPSNVRQ
jgi:F0F1-type ATP synthase membrane subunit b/b'